jgi:hypothetical protein
MIRVFGDVEKRNHGVCQSVIPAVASYAKFKAHPPISNLRPLLGATDVFGRSRARILGKHLSSFLVFLQRCRYRA